MRRSRSRMRGGVGKAVGGAGDATVAEQDSAAPPKKVAAADKDKEHGSGKEGFGTMAGGRRHRRSHRRRSRRMSRRVVRRTHRRRSHRRRGGMGHTRRTLAKAIVPFGLWGAQRLMRRKKNRRTMKRMGKRVTSLL
jgi:hypothetical protein